MDFRNLLLYLDYLLKNTSIKILKSLLFKPTQAFKNGRILIFRTGSIGDSICAFPSIAAIRNKYPDSSISLLTNPAGKNVSMEYLLDPSLGIQIVNYQKLGFLKLFKMLREGNYDLFIELPQTHSSWTTNIRNLLTAKLIGASYGFGWAVYATTHFKHFQEKHNHFMPESERLLQLLQKEGISGNPKIYPLAFSDEYRLRITSFLSENGILDKSKNIGIVAGAKRTTNRWPTANFREVMGQLSQKGYRLILIGGRDDLDQNTPFLDIPNVKNAVGIFIPIESALLMAQCKLVISNDTGPLHLSYAVGTPVVGIYSSRDYPKHWFPPSTSSHKVLRSSAISCGVCLLEECPHQLKCLKEINPRQVLMAVEELLQKNE